MPRLVLACAFIVAVATHGCSRGSAGARLERGDAWFAKGEFGRAMEEYRAALELEPRSDRALHAIGLVHYSRGDYEQALDFLDRAIELDPERAGYRLQRGHTLLRLYRFRAAIEEYEHVIRLDPSLSEAYYSIGIAHYNARDYDLAARWLERYLHIDPKADDRERVRELIRSLESWSP